MIQDITSIHQNMETELAFVLTATRQEWETAKSGGGVDVYDLFGGTYEESKQRAENLAQAIKFDYRSSYALSYFNQQMSAAAMQAYSDCLSQDKETPGLALWLDSRQGDYFTFDAFWVGNDVKAPTASYDSPPIVDGGRLVSKPDQWLKAKTEQIVAKRDGNVDMFLNLRVGGQEKSIVVVQDPPNVVWQQELVQSVNDIAASSHGPNPGCSAGQATDCISTAHPGGHFVAGTAVVSQRTSSDPGRYTEKISTDTPTRICITITQSTGACEVNQSAKGKVTAMETFPTAQ